MVVTRASQNALTQYLTQKTSMISTEKWGSKKKKNLKTLVKLSSAVDLYSFRNSAAHKSFQSTVHGKDTVFFSSGILKEMPQTHICHL